MPGRPRKTWIVVAKSIFRLLVILLVAWGLARAVNRALRDLRREQEQLNAQLHAIDQQIARLAPGGEDVQQRLAELQRERGELQRQRFSLRQLRPSWLCLAAGFYCLGMVPSWVYWHLTLRALQQHPSWWTSLRAFFIGHLGKYVPGKALVVVIRAKLVSGPTVDVTAAAASVFVETLTTMAVGASVAAAILSCYAKHWLMLLVALSLMLAAGLPTTPPIFRRLVRLVQAERANPEILHLLQGLNFRLLGCGWLLILFAWIFNGLSLWAVIRSLPGVASVGVEHLPLLIAAVALAMVAGFLSLIPGGAIVRELVVTSLLAPVFGPVIAVSSAILLRLTWLMSELVISSILYLGERWRPKEVMVAEQR